MSNPPRAAGDVGGDGEDDIDKTVAKTAGFVVFSGIAMSILKALNPFNNKNQCTAPKMEPLNESTPTKETHTPPPPPCCRSSRQPPLQESPFQSPVTTLVGENVVEVVEQNVMESTAKTIEIVKGDTLWGLSRKYGVPIEAIKEANGLTGDTIYAGKKLIIP